ncbi:MAG TPA: substrate-binding domain-containing protein [Thermoplasmata archaeon]|nr:substrate-binding domain-containing protein [Thermoplasmata archaeon]
MALIAAVAAVIAFVAGFGAGWYGHAPSSSGGSNSPPASVTLSVTAAGSLAVNFPALASAFANATPAVTAPAAAQQFQGSIAALSAISGLHDKYDIAAVADYHLIPRMLEPGYATWEVVFAGNPVVLAYDPSVSAFHNINSTNWASELESSGTMLGVANASADPMGYNAIFALQLEGLREGTGLSSIYGHFYSGAPGALAVANPSTTRVEPETQAAALLKAHTVGAFFVYQSYAHSSNLNYVLLPTTVDLGATDSASLALYNQSSTTITTTNGPLVIRGAPVLFAITVPSNAPDPTVAVEFVAFLLAREGTTLSSGGFVPLVPAYVDNPSALPAPLIGAVAPLPSVLAAQLG